MAAIITFLQNAIRQGVCILFGANGEILTEKSGNLNLGVPGMMYMGGIAGLAAAFMYERGVQTPSPAVGFLLALLAALAAGGLGGLVYSVLTISLRANQNVSGLALTTFGVGVGNFFGGSLSKLAGGVGQISTAATASQPRSPKPLLVQVPPEYSITKYRPPSPQIAPPMTVARYLYSDTLMPAASAVAGFSPTARRHRPWRVQFRYQDSTMDTATAM